MKGVMAGIMIGIGCWVYCICPNKIVGAFLFSIGLCTILETGLNLFTGKVGYYINDFKKWPELVYMWFQNFAGISLVAIVAKYRITTDMVARSDNSLGMMLALGIFCGILMYSATKFKGRYVCVSLCVATFILAGFEHCIADIFYLVCDPRITLREATLMLLTVTLGNMIGGYIANKSCN